MCILEKEVLRLKSLGYNQEEILDVLSDVAEVSIITIVELVGEEDENVIGEETITRLYSQGLTVGEIFRYTSSYSDNLTDKEINRKLDFIEDTIIKYQNEKLVNVSRWRLK